MQRRSFRIALEVAAGIIAGLAILIGIGFWRLSAGPISLSFLTPAVQNALNQVDSQFDIEVEDTVLSWGGWDRAIDILIKNVTLRQDGNQPMEDRLSEAESRNPLPGDGEPDDKPDFGIKF